LTSRANDELGDPAAFYSYESAYSTMEEEFKALSKNEKDRGVV
jgi:hypothetical protein